MCFDEVVLKIKVKALFLVPKNSQVYIEVDNVH